MKRDEKMKRDDIVEIIISLIVTLPFSVIAIGYFILTNF